MSGIGVAGGAVRKQRKAPARKFYAVRRGARTGIFEDWEECKGYVYGFKNASFKSFAKADEAQAWLEGSPPPPDSGRLSEDGCESSGSDQAWRAEASYSPSESLVTPGATYRLDFDGGARGNPGPAGFGYAIVDAGADTILMKRGGCLPLPTTNNVAEYSGLIAGLEAALALGVRNIAVQGDSEVVVKQWRGCTR